MAPTKFSRWYAETPHAREDVPLKDIQAHFTHVLDLEASLQTHPTYRSVIAEFNRHVRCYAQRLPPRDGEWIPMRVLTDSNREARTMIYSMVLWMPDYMTATKGPRERFFTVNAALAIFFTLNADNKVGKPSLRSRVLYDSLEPGDMEILKQAEEEYEQDELYALGLSDSDDDTRMEEESKDREADPDVMRQKWQLLSVRKQGIIRAYEADPGIVDLTPVIFEGEEYLLLNDILHVPYCVRLNLRLDELLAKLAEDTDTDYDTPDLPPIEAERSSYRDDSITDWEAYQALQRRMSTVNLPTEEEFMFLQQRNRPKVEERTAALERERAKGKQVSQERASGANLERVNLTKYDWENWGGVEVDHFAGRHREVPTASGRGKSKKKGCALRYYLSLFEQQELIIVHKQFTPRGEEAHFLLRALSGFGYHSAINPHSDHIILVKRKAALCSLDFALGHDRTGVLTGLASIDHGNFDAEEMRQALEGRTLHNVVKNLQLTLKPSQVEKELGKPT